VLWIVRVVELNPFAGEVELHLATVRSAHGIQR
jgi:hypothetical protein